MITLSRRTFLTGCVLGSVGVAGCAVPGTLESRRTSDEIEIPTETALVVANQNGDVRLEGISASTATLEVEKSTRYGAELLDQVSIETGRSGDQFRVETIDDTPPGRSVGVDITIYLPDEVPVERVVTTNGDVTAQDVEGDATLQSTNGDVLAEAVGGYVTVRSGNGDVETRAVTGVGGARTTNGDVNIEVPAIRGDVSVETTNGDIRMAVAADLDAVVDLRTVNGRVGYSDLALETSVDRSRHVRGTLGSGGDELAAETTNGDVRLRSL